VEEGVGHPGKTLSRFWGGIWHQEKGRSTSENGADQITPEARRVTWPVQQGKRMIFLLRKVSRKERRATMSSSWKGPGVKDSWARGNQQGGKIPERRDAGGKGVFLHRRKRCQKRKKKEGKGPRSSYYRSKESRHRDQRKRKRPCGGKGKLVHTSRELFG